MPTNADIEAKIAQSIPEILREMGILPNGYQCEVHLHRGTRKKRRDAAFDQNWDPEMDTVRIAFTSVEEDEDKSDNAATSAGVASSAPFEDRLSDLLCALNRAEARPGYEFVSLKWFRDTALSHEKYVWAEDETARHDMLRDAIDRRLILTSKIANPRPPHFPVTAIRLNRQMPEVITALGGSAGNSPAFRPVSIRGEALSSTVLRDRR